MKRAKCVCVCVLYAKFENNVKLNSTNVSYRLIFRQLMNIVRGVKQYERIIKNLIICIYSDNLTTLGIFFIGDSLNELNKFGRDLRIEKEMNSNIDSTVEKN